MAHHFRVGQKVRLIKNNSMVAEIGATAIIVKLPYSYYDYRLISVEWLTGSGRQMNGGYEADKFEPLYLKNAQFVFEFMNDE